MHFSTQKKLITVTVPLIVHLEPPGTVQGSCSETNRIPRFPVNLLPVPQVWGCLRLVCPGIGVPRCPYVLQAAANGTRTQLSPRGTWEWEDGSGHGEGWNVSSRCGGAAEVGTGQGQRAEGAGIDGDQTSFSPSFESILLTDFGHCRQIHSMLWSTTILPSARKHAGFTLLITITVAKPASDLYKPAVFKRKREGVQFAVRDLWIPRFVSVGETCRHSPEEKSSECSEEELLGQGWLQFKAKVS